MTGDFNFELDRIARTISEKGYRRISLQFPEGLKRRAVEVALDLESMVETGTEIMISGEPCFGACDVISTPGVLTVNFGHLPIPSMRQEDDVIHIPASSNVDPMLVINEAIKDIEGPVGLVFTPQFIHRKDEVLRFLADKGIEGIIGKGDSRIFSEGQVLGCNTSAGQAVADTAGKILYVGSGNFHPLALALGTNMDIIIADPIKNEVRRINEFRDRVLRQRHSAITLVEDAKVFGIILSTKTGQRREELAKQISDRLRSKGRSGIIIEIENVSPPLLNSFKVDAWVSTACPRLAIDDHRSYPTPILTPPELEILLGDRKWDDYVFDEI